AVVFLYDAVLTTGQEVTYFWGRRVTGATILFWLNKYMTMLYMVWNLATSHNISDESRSFVCSCKISVRGDVAVDYLLFLVIAVFTAMRVYALRKSLLLGSITFILSMVPIGTNFTFFRFGLTGENISPFGCQAVDTVSLMLEPVTIVTRSCVIAADCLAITATWFTLDRSRSILHMVRPKGTLSSVFLVDGTIYFATLVVLNCLHLAFTLLSLEIGALQPTSVVGDFTVPISAILLSRFLLHLQSASLRAVGSLSSSQASSAPDPDRSITFERVVGSLSASITADDYNVEQEVDAGKSEDVDMAAGGGSDQTSPE
ncbi:hypothetical protein BD309DRAFT_877374, partial [Dichomitus squalens]